MISRAIWHKYARVTLSKTNKIAQTQRASEIYGRKKVWSLVKQFLLSFSSKLLFSLLEYLSLTLYYLKTGFLSANQSEDIFSCLLLQSKWLPPQEKKYGRQLAIINNSKQ